MPTRSPRRRRAGLISRAQATDLSYIVSLQKKNHEALGFLPRVALAEKIELGRIWLTRENDEPAGFLHHGSLAAPEVRIFQAAIQYDARRRHHGMALVADLLQRATAAGARGVSLRCLDFLDANDFWTAAGFTLLGTELGGRGTLNVWGRRLGVGEGGISEGMNGRRGEGEKTSALSPLLPFTPSPLLRSSSLPTFTFHSRVHPCPRCGVPTTDTWTRGAVRRRLCPRCVATE